MAAAYRALVSRTLRRVVGRGAPAPFRTLICAAALCVLAATGCARQQQEQSAAPLQGKAATPSPAPADKKLSPWFIRVSVYVTDARTVEPVEDAEVIIGAEQLLPTPLPRDYDENPAGLYATEDLEGGTYFFRVRRKGYRALAGKLFVPPVPERFGEPEPPVVLELEDARESGEGAGSVQVMLLWQKHHRGAEPGGAPHPPMEKPSGVSPHGVNPHSAVAAPESAPGK